MSTLSINTLDDLAPEANWLESAHGFDRWAIDAEHSVWVCGDCGAIVAATEDGCPACGMGTEDPEMEAIEWTH